MIRLLKVQKVPISSLQTEALPSRNTSSHTNSMLCTPRGLHQSAGHKGHAVMTTLSLSRLPNRALRHAVARSAKGRRVVWVGRQPLQGWRVAEGNGRGRGGDSKQTTEQQPGQVVQLFMRGGAAERGGDALVNGRVAGKTCS